MARPRRGTALVAALGLLALAAALLAGAVVASFAARRGTRVLVAASRADSEARRALGEVMVGWDGAADSLALGGSLERVISATSAAGPPLAVQARLDRLSPSVFAASVSVQVGATASVQAYRRMRLLLERSAHGDSASVSRPPSPIARWSVIEVH